MEFPRLPIGDGIEIAVKWLTVNSADFFRWHKFGSFEHDGGNGQFPPSNTMTGSACCCGPDCREDSRA